MTSGHGTTPGSERPRSEALRSRAPRVSPAAATLVIVVVFVLLSAGADWHLGADENPRIGPLDDQRMRPSDATHPALLLSATPPAPQNTTTATARRREAAPPLATSADEVEVRAPERLGADDLRRYEPNELGVVPVLEYHLFTTDPAKEDELTRPIDDFRADLAWLYEHDFYVIPMVDLVRNQISAPPGKHPVVLTFDDASAGQFRIIRNERDQLMVDPESAVGVMELFYQAHPDFGRGGFFAVLSFNCFAEPTEPEQMPYCDQKLAWLIDHGYEVGNHTKAHADLRDVSDERFVDQIGGAIAWLDEHAPGHTGTIIVMPFGSYPDEERHPEQLAMLRDGFTYNGRVIKMEAALKVGSEPSVSPSSRVWDPIWIPRIQAFDATLEHWFSMFTEGKVILYTSDGNPDTVTVPDPLPGWLDGHLDASAIAASGKELRVYQSSREA